MTIAYPDVSNHDGAIPLEAATVACFAKSSEGTGYQDAYYLHFKAEAKRVGAMFGAYHFLTQGDGAAQARFAYSIVGPGVPMMIDFEPEFDANGQPVSEPSLADAIAFRDTYRSLGGLVRLVYLPHWYWAGHLGAPSLAPLADLGLVASDYTTYSDSGPGWAPYGGLTPAVWQWTDRQPYSGRLLDFNAFRGTVDQFRALLGLTQQSPQEAPVTPDEMEALAQWIENRKVGVIPATNPETTTTLGVETASNPARWAELNGKIDALGAAIGKLGTPPPAQVDLVALEALIEQHLAAGSVPGVIAVAVAKHLGADLAAG